MPRIHIYVNSSGDDFVDAFVAAGLDAQETTIMVRPASGQAAHVYTLVSHAGNSTAIATALLSFVAAKTGRTLSVEMNGGSALDATRLIAPELGRLLATAASVRIDEGGIARAAAGTSGRGAAAPWWKFWR